MPHTNELMQLGYEELFLVMEQQEEMKLLINPFISALKNNAKAQLEGQIASAKIDLARLAFAQLY